MRRRFFVLLVLFLIFSTITGTVYAQTIQTYKCPGREGTPKKRSKHLELLKYAILADLAYTKRVTNQNVNLREICPMGTGSHDSYDVEIGRVPVEILNEASSRLKDTGKYKKEKWKIESNGNSVSCIKGETVMQRLTVAFRYVLSNDSLSLLAKVAIVGTMGFTAEEQIDFVKFTKNIIGVKGTNPLKIEQWNTSIQNLIGKSCIFDFAVKVSTLFFGRRFAGEIRKYKNKNYYSIVGHSLGGAVAQYVAQKKDLKTIVQKHNKNATFRAYSFNSIGVDSNTESSKHQSTITSVRVAGEILGAHESMFQRKQIGHFFRYGTISSARLPLPQKIKYQLQRHKIETVKQEICDCLADERRMFGYKFIK